MLGMMVAMTLSVAKGFAGTMSTQWFNTPPQPVLAMFGGFSGLSAGYSQSYVGTDDTVFRYKNTNNTLYNGLIGGFLGAEWAHVKYMPALLLQTGLEYTYLGNTSLSGSDSVGIQPNTATFYDYRYTLKSQQLLGVVKLLSFPEKRWHPYVSAGVGAAFNTMKQFGAVTDETDSINLTPSFADNNSAQFSYALGAGIDTVLTNHARLALGYRFTDIGQTTLQNGIITTNAYSTALNFALSSPRVYMNQLVIQLAYLA